MLHRMTMRVVPALTVAVTDEEFRRRKRILMVFPWLIAFALYRGLKAMAWHDDIIALLLSSGDRKSTRLNSSHSQISYAVFCLKKKISTPTGTHRRDKEPAARGLCRRE